MSFCRERGGYLFQRGRDHPMVGLGCQKIKTFTANWTAARFDSVVTILGSRFGGLKCLRGRVSNGSAAMRLSALMTSFSAFRKPHGRSAVAILPAPRKPIF